MTGGGAPVAAGYRRRVVLVLVLAGVLFSWNAGGYHPWAPDEPYFAEGAREMVADGQWLVPHVLGQVTTDKPPLFFWLIAGCYRLLGVVPLAARIPSILAGLLAVGLVIRLGRRLESETAGLLAGVVLATTWLSWDKFRTAQIDGLLCALVLAALAVVEAWRSGEVRGRPAGIAFWALAGLATLAKGPVGLLVPLGVTIAWLAAIGEGRRLREFAPILGPLVYLGVTLSWAVPATVLSGGEYSVIDAVRVHFVGRAAHGMHHLQPPWYYLVVTPPQLLPWTGLALVGAWIAWRERRRPGRALLLCWAGFVLLLFSVSREKRDLYVLPAFPAFALLAALAADHCLREEAACRAGGRRVARLALGLPLVPLLLAGIAIPVVARERLPGLFPAALLAGGILAAGSAVALALALRGRVRGGIVATAVTVAAFYLALAGVVYPRVDHLKDPGRIVAALAGCPAGARVASLGLGNLPRAIAWGTGGIYPEELGGVEEALRWLGRPGEAWLVTDAAGAARISSDPRAAPVEEVCRQRLARREVVLLHRPP